MNVHGYIIDISSNNHHGDAPISWSHVKKAGVIAVVVKATQGATNVSPDKWYINPWYRRDVAEAMHVGLPVIAYHYASISDHSKGADPAVEMEFFRRTAGEGFARCLDVETSTDRAWCNAALGHLNGDNFKKVLYGSESSMEELVHQGQIYARLWPAAYPGPVHFGAMHQFSDKGQIPGIIGNVDLSVWRKTRGEFIALFGEPPVNQFRNFIKHKILKKK
jgi:GH25 family lysozyme M1 (1,4-beta-N-acetylmuramidase)